MAGMIQITTRLSRGGRLRRRPPYWVYALAALSVAGLAAAMLARF